MALFRFSDVDPIAGLMALQRELDRVFENPLGAELGPSGRGVFPPVNVFANRDGWVLKLEIPGVDPSSLHVDSENRTLRVAGKRETAPPEGASCHRRERGAGEFSRAVQLPPDLDLARADAAYERGVLTIRVPKREEAKPRQITVKAA